MPGSHKKMANWAKAQKKKKAVTHTPSTPMKKKVTKLKPVAHTPKTPLPAQKLKGKHPFSPQTPLTPATPPVKQQMSIGRQATPKHGYMPGNSIAVKLQTSVKQETPIKQETSVKLETSMPPLERVSTNQQGTNYTPVVLTEQGDEGFRMESPDTMRISPQKPTVDEPFDGHYYNFMNRKRPNNNMGLVLQARQNFMKHVSEISSMY